MELIMILTNLGTYRSFYPRNIQKFADIISSDKLLHISNHACPQVAYSELHKILTEELLNIFQEKPRRKHYFN